MANFRVVASNCGCCAIKHIRDIPSSPDNDDFLLYSDGGHDEDQSSSQPEAYENWAQEIEPKPATAGDAMKAVVAQIKRRRPAGIITVNLVEHLEDEDEDFHRGGDYNDSCPRAWDPIMEELGFTKVVVLNSNSDNKIHHYTCVYDEK
jgi:hypothetical protein